MKGLSMNGLSMNGLSMNRAAVVAFPIVVLAACSSENLQTTGLDPANTVNSQEPAVMMPNRLAPDPNAGAPTMPAIDDDVDDPPSSEGNQADMLVPNQPVAPADDTMDPDDPMETPMDPAPVTPPVVPTITPAMIGGQLEGFLHLAPCQSQDFGHDCTLPGCQGNAKVTVTPIQLGGDSTKVYDVTVHVYGVVEPRVYQGGERRAGANFDPNGDDFWYEGGSIPANPGTYNSYELHVTPPVDGAANDYYLNSRTGGDVPTMIKLDYEAQFPVRGGGVINFRSADSNCRQITNCAIAECGPVAPRPLTLPEVMNANPAPAILAQQPYNTGANIGRGQWVYIDVTQVAERP